MVSLIFQPRQLPGSMLIYQRVIWKEMSWDSITNNVILGDWVCLKMGYTPQIAIYCRKSRFIAEIWVTLFWTDPQITRPRQGLPVDCSLCRAFPGWFGMCNFLVGAIWPNIMLEQETTKKCCVPKSSTSWIQQIWALQRWQKWKNLHDGAPKIAKLVYKWVNNGLW